MALYTVSVGNVIAAADLNQFYNWLVGGTVTDTPLVMNYATVNTAAITISNTGGAGALGLTVSGTIGVGSIAVNNAALYLTPSLVLVSTGQFGLYSNVAFTSAATVSGTAVYAKLQTAAAAFTMTAGYGIYIADAVKGAASAITTQYGLYIVNQTQGGINYGIYSAGSVQNYLGGSLTINAGGMTVTGDITAPASTAMNLTSNATSTWSITNGNLSLNAKAIMFVQTNSVTAIQISTVTISCVLPLITPASVTGGAGFNVPHGTAPTSPVNGDIWTTTGGLFVRVNGVTKTVTLT